MSWTPWSVTELLIRVPTHGPQTETSPYGDRTRPHPYNSIIPGTENLRCVGATHPHLLLHTTPLLDVAHTYDYFQLPHPAAAPHHVEFNPPLQLMHSPYSLLSAGSELSDHTPITCRSVGFPQPSGLYSPWGSFRPSPVHLPIATCDVSPPSLHHSSDPTLCPDTPFRQPPWPTGDVRVGSVDEVLPAPSNYDLPVLPLPNSGPPPHPNLDNISEPYSGTLDPSYPCLWTEGGIICNVMVQATRSHMNRHLHAYHGFCGSDTRQTKCHWAGCGAVMQQGSIARHMVSCHLQAKVTCPMCSKKLSRQDVISKHQRVCPAAGTWR
ncbi:hypothetical protein OG21DRAFT_1504666 [Imleria badia]|nr:hypothetical protein OG21DRAFT_1504666 [Imleria badia]